MRAIQIERFGGPEVLAEADVPEPTPTPGKVLIDVTAAGINYADTHRVADDYLADRELTSSQAKRGVGTLEDGSTRIRRILTSRLWRCLRRPRP